MRRRQVLALDQFHDEGRRAPALFQAVDAGDVRMVQRREDFGFALKPSQPIVIRRDGRRQDLDGDLALQPGVGGPIHLPHSALTEQGGDFIDAETGAGSESQE